jgi:hypothetical protein
MTTRTSASLAQTISSKRSLFALLLAAPLLTACYVVPVHPDGRVYPPPGSSAGTAPFPAPITVIAAPPGPMVFTARLYPSNDTAARNGIIAGSSTSPQDGKGVFTIPYGGDTLSGEATRTTAGSVHSGVANASGPRGTYVRCTYRMNNTSQGTGECMFSDGARFQMHVGG